MGNSSPRRGPLDPRFWPDGIYTAPTDEALRFDVEMMKKLGFNCVRKHVKRELTAGIIGAISSGF
jgi:hypothetical protein